MDYSSYMETIIFRTAAMLGFRRLQSYMLPCLYALLLLPYIVIVTALYIYYYIYLNIKYMYS